MIPGLDTDPDARDRRVADAVIHHLALDEAEWRARVVELEADLVAYRELLQLALAVAHDVTVDRNQLRDRYHQTLDKNRRLRAALTAGPRAA